MVEANFEKGCSRGVSRDVAADAVLFAVGADDHGQRVPTQKALDAALDFLIAGEFRLLRNVNRIYVWSVRGKRNTDAGDLRVGAKLGENAAGRLHAAAVDHRIERLEPLANFLLIIPDRIHAGTICSCHVFRCLSSCAESASLRR